MCICCKIKDDLNVQTAAVTFTFDLHLEILLGRVQLGLNYMSYITVHLEYMVEYGCIIIY